MVKHRSHSIEFKRQAAQEFLAGETLQGLAKRHDISRNLIRVWVGKHEAGAFDKVEGVYPMAFETFDDVAAELPRFIGKYNDRRLHSALRYRSPAQFDEENARSPVKTAA